MSERQAGTFTKKTFTPAEVKLSEILAKAVRDDLDFRGVEMLLNEPVPTNEANSRGLPKSLYPDNTLRDGKTGFKYAIEAMGAGSKSDNFKRHQTLVSSGFHMVYLTNDEILQTPGPTLRKIGLIIKMMRAMFA